MVLSGYTYYKKGAVNATTAGAQTLYQLKLIVGESSGASGADIHCENHCLDFPNDIRFTKEDGETKHDYWVDTSSLEGTTPNRKVSVWIEVASIPASGSVDFYMYYRKTSDSGESSGDDTFAFFADFTASDIDNNGSQESINVESGTWGVKYNSLYQDPKCLTSAGPSHCNKDAAVIKKGDTYHLFYTRRMADKGVGHAVSNDKIHWTFKQEIAIPSGYCGIWANDIFLDGSTYYLFVTGNPTGGWDWTNGKILYYTSSDLESWTYQGVFFDSPGSWSNGGTGDSELKKFGSTYYLYYFGARTSDGKICIGVATSSTITGTYTAYAGNPILAPTLSWEGTIVEAPVINLVGSTYYLHYGGNDSVNGQKIGYATATNPLGSFTKQGQVTISPSAEWRSYASDMVVHPDVLQLDGEWTLWFGGAEGASGHIQEITYATGTFPNTWTPKPEKMYRVSATPSGLAAARLADLDMKNLAVTLKTKNRGTDGNNYIIWRAQAGVDDRYQVRIELSGTYDDYIALECGAGGWQVITRAALGWEVDPYLWQTIEVRTYNNNVKIYVEGTKFIDIDDTAITTSGKIKLGTYNEQADFDEVRVRKYVSPEPTWGSWGGETATITPKTSSDTGGGIDALTSLSAVITQSDLGSGAESIGSRAFGLCEVGSGADALSQLIATLTKSDQGTGADLLAALIKEVIAIYSSDTGSGADALTSLSAVITQSDIGSGAESLRSRALGAVDQGAGTDALSELIATILESDQGTGTDILATLINIIHKNDTGAGADALTSLLAAITQSDIGSGAESLRSRALGAVDQGAGTDALSELIATIFESDSGIGTDAVSKLLATILKSDTGSGIETATKVVCIYILLKVLYESKIYHQGETLRQKARVTDVSRTLIDPNTIVITIIDSENTKKVNAQAMTKDVTGKYHYDYLIPTDAMVGKWTTEIKAVKGFTAIEQDQFTVVEAIA